MALVNGGYLHYKETCKEVLQNSSSLIPQKTKQKNNKLAIVLSKIQVRDPGSSWSSCF